MTRREWPISSSTIWATSSFTSPPSPRPRRRSSLAEGRPAKIDRGAGEARARDAFAREVAHPGEGEGLRARHPALQEAARRAVDQVRSAAADGQIEAKP